MCISSTSTHPEKAMQVLNLIWEDPELSNTLAYGVEGVDYVIDENGHSNPTGEGKSDSGVDGTNNTVLKTLASANGADFINIIGDWVMYTDSDVENTLKYLYPEAIYTELIGTDAEKNFGEGGSEEIEISDININSCNMLNEEPWLDMLEQYFVSTARNCGIEHDVPVMVTASCLADVSYTIASAGTEEEVNISVVAVQIAGEGWKIIPYSSQQLASML